MKRRRKKKRRQSLLLPSDLDPAPPASSAAPAAASAGASAGAGGGLPPPPPRCGPPSSGPVPPPSPLTEEALLQAVRAVCSLPEAERRGSAPGRAIEGGGRYPFMRHCRGGGEGDSEEGLAEAEGEGGAAEDPLSPATLLERRRGLLLALGPVVERMEARKREEIEAAQRATGCRVVARSRGGRFRYRDLATDEEVRPSVYGARYCAMIERRREERRRRREMKGEGGREGEAAGGGGDETAGADRSGEGGADATEEALGATANNDALDSDHGSDDMDISMDLPPMRDADGADSGSDPGSEDEARAPAATSASECRAPSTAPTAALLPLPSRDEPNPDPEIAVIERMLWSEIDAARAKYSREILAMGERERAANG